MTHPLVRALAIAAVAVAATPAAAGTCPRDAALPVELPWMKCPTEVTVPVCLRGCMKSTRRVDLTYEGDIAAIGKRWIAALDQAGWDLTMIPVPLGQAPKPGDPLIVIEARSGHDRATTTVTFGAASDSAVLKIVFEPG
jgi:hypothetical protein